MFSCSKRTYSDHPSIESDLDIRILLFPGMSVLVRRLPYSKALKIRGFIVNM